MTDASWETLSNQAVAAAGVVYFLALMAHLVQWASLRKLPADEVVTTGRTAHGRPPRRAADRGGGARARSGAPRPGHGRGPQPGALGQHVRVHALRHLRRHPPLPAPAAPLRPRVDGPPRRRPRAGADDDRASSGSTRRSRRSPRRSTARGWSSTWCPRSSPPAPSPSAASARCSTCSRSARPRSAATSPGCPSWPRSTGSPTGCTPSRSRCGPSPCSSPAPIWAHQAWSSYWNWDPKEVWAFITWVVYAAYLHARATVGWKGRNAAYVALVGLATLWFNFIGINFFSTSSQHSYAAPALVEQRPAYDDVAPGRAAQVPVPVPPGPPVPPSS